MCLVAEMCDNVLNNMDFECHNSSSFRWASSLLDESSNFAWFKLTHTLRDSSIDLIMQIKVPILSGAQKMVTNCMQCNDRLNVMRKPLSNQFFCNGYHENAKAVGQNLFKSIFNWNN